MNFAFKVWLWLPLRIHRLIFALLFGLWMFFRPKYRRRIRDRIQCLNTFRQKIRPNSLAPITPRQIYWNLYFNQWIAFRWIAGVKAPKVNIVGELPQSPTAYWSLHWGAFEALHPLLAEKMPLCIPVASRLSFLNHLRKNRGQSLVHFSDSRGLIHEIRQQTNLALLIDQNPSSQKIDFEFFKESDLSIQLSIWPKTLEKAYQNGYEICAFWCKATGAPHNPVLQLEIKKLDLAKFSKEQSAHHREQLKVQLIDLVREKLNDQPEYWVWHYGKSPVIAPISTSPDQGLKKKRNS